MLTSLVEMNELGVPYMSQSAKEKMKDVSRCSSLNRLLRVTPICSRFVNNKNGPKK